MPEMITTRSVSQAQARGSKFHRNLESSQLPANQHDIYLLRFLSLPVTYQMVSYLSAYTSAIVDEVLTTLPNTPQTPNGGPMPELEDFVLHVCRQSNVSTPTLMVAVIYLARLRSSMPYQAIAMPGTAHRLFLAALIISSKFCNDTCPRNKTWVQATGGLFDIDEVNLMEKQFLLLLDYDLIFDEEEAIWHFQPVIEVLGSDLRDIESYSRTKRECSIKTAPPPTKKAVLSPAPRTGRDAFAPVQRRQATVSDESEAGKMEKRTSAIRRVARGSAERMERGPASSKPISAPAPVMIAPPRSSMSRSSSRMMDTSPDVPAPPPKRSSALSARLARAPSTDSVSSNSAGSLTADEGMSSSSSSSALASDLDQDEDDGIIRVVASLQVDEGSRGFRIVNGDDMTGVGAGVRGSKKQHYSALQQTQQPATDARRHPRFSWTRRRSETLKGGAPVSSSDERQQQPARMDRAYYAPRASQRSSVGSVIDLNDESGYRTSSSRRSSRTSRSAFSSSTGTIVCPSDVTMATSVSSSMMMTKRSNRHASTATITASERPLTFENMGVPISIAPPLDGGKHARSSSRHGNGSGGLSLSASLRSFLTGGGRDERERQAGLI